MEMGISSLGGHRGMELWREVGTERTKACATDPSWVRATERPYLASRMLCGQLFLTRLLLLLQVSAPAVPPQSPASASAPLLTGTLSPSGDFLIIFPH